MVELAYALVVETDDFTIQDGTLHGKFRERSSQQDKFELIQIAGNQFALAVLDVCDGAEAVVFQFEDVVGIIKWFCDALETH